MSYMIDSLRKTYLGRKVEETLTHRSQVGGSAQASVSNVSTEALVSNVDESPFKTDALGCCERRCEQ